MAPGLFLGALLIILGIAAILRVVFDIHVFGILFACLLIAFGISLLVRKPWMIPCHRDKRDTIFAERFVSEQPPNHIEYNLIFGHTVYDFRNIVLPSNEPVSVSINAVFGSAVILVNPQTPLKVNADAVFASASVPSGSSVSFGNIQFATESLASSPACLNIKASVVFGSLQVRAE
jgi:hypothetical protein